jgi:transcriptional regulator with XRE-family HTH domain
MQSIHKPQYIEFIARLRKSRKDKGLTQAQLGRLLGQPQSFISKVETCERRLDLIEAAEWCRGIGIHLEDVLPIELRASLEQARVEQPAPHSSPDEWPR